MGILGALGAPIRGIATLVDKFLNTVLFNLILFGASSLLLALIAAQNCHGDDGEKGFWCSKVWEKCKNMQSNGISIIVNGSLQCPIRACPWPHFYDPAVCSPILLPYTDQSFFSFLLVQVNYWLRWIFTGILVGRMLSKGLLLSEGSYFRDFYCIVDTLVMASAWLNIYFPHGNLMFLMILRGNQITTTSTYPRLAPVRVIVNSIMNGASELSCLYALISFFMVKAQSFKYPILLMAMCLMTRTYAAWCRQGFFGLLAMSLIGSKGDFHNRCAVPLYGEDGSFTYEPIMPPTTCRMDHLYNPSQYKDCYGDVWETNYLGFVPASRPPGVTDPTGPGCRGTCSTNLFYNNDILGSQINLTVVGRNNRFGSAITGNQVYCIGPDLFPIDLATFPPTTQESLPLQNYVGANLTNWPAILDIRSWDNIGAASISVYTIYFRSAWSDVFDATRASTTSNLFVVWVFIIMSITYYILNTSVGIICRNYSVALEQEAAAVEARKAAEQPPSLDDGGDEENEENEEGDDDEDDEQDMSGLGDESKTIRAKLMLEMNEYTNENPCGKGCGNLPVVIPNALSLGAEIVGKFMAVRIKLLGYACHPVCPNGRSPWQFCKDNCLIAVRSCCRGCLSVAIFCSMPNVTIEDYRSGLGVSPLEVIGLASTCGTLLTLLMQQDTINAFKCGCTDAQINAAKNLNTLAPCTLAGECLNDGNLTSTAFSCVMNRCVQNAVGMDYACINPLWNSQLEALRIATGSPSSQPTATDWENARTQWCSFGLYLHYALYGWAGILLIETVLNFLGHLGWTNYLTNKLYEDKRKVKGIFATIPIISTFYEFGFNLNNVVDAVANVATAAGIVLTEISIGSQQVLDGRVSYDAPSSHLSFSAWLSTSSLPWVFKFLRIAVLLRLLVRIRMLERNSMCAAVIRGLRGIDRLLIGQVMILYTIFLFALVGKEIFDYGYSNMNGPYISYSDFHDLPESLVPLLNIMASGSFYEYAKEATLVLSVPGFVFVSFYYFIVNFQVLNIFIAIIVQNYVLKDDEKIEAQKSILRSNFEKAKIQKIAVNNEYEKSWSHFKRHYNELLVGAQVSLRSLMLFQRNIANVNGPFNKELEDYLAGIDSSKDIMAKVVTEDKTEAEKAAEREREVAQKLSIRKEYFDMDDKGDSIETEPSYYDRFVKSILLLLKSQRWNMIVGAVVIFSTAMAAWTNLPPAIDLYISVALLGFFFFELILKVLGYGLIGKFTNTDGPLVVGGIFYYIQGVVKGEGRRCAVPGYFLRPWCVLEVLILLVMVIDVYLSLLPKELQFTDPNLFKGLRSVRIIRLLSNLQRAKIPQELEWKEGMGGVRYPGIKFSDRNPVRTIMLALGASLPSIFLLMVIAFGMLVIFSLVGVEQFGGLLHACSNDDSLYNTETRCNNTDSDCFPGYPGQCQSGICLVDKQSCYGNKLVVPKVYSSTNWKSVNPNSDFIFLQPRTWANARLSFDTAPQAFFATFCSISRSGVTFLMQSLGSITGRTSAPVSGYSSSFYVYVIILNLVVGVFVCQVVIGIILTNLQLKSGYAFHTKEQLVWPATKNMFDRYFPDPKVYPANKEQGIQSSDTGKQNPWMLFVFFIRQRMSMVQASWKFKLLVTATIFVNIGTLLSYSYDSSGTTYLREFWIGFACFLVYVLEAIVKIISEPKRYFSNSSDQIDFALTVWNAIEIFVTPHVLGVDVSVASLRMFRLFNLLMQIDAMVQLVKMITGGILEAFASGILLGFILFIFGCIGTRFFSFVKDGIVISPTQFGFTSLPEALITLFKLSSSTDTFLLDVISDSKVTAPSCTAPNWIPYGAPGFTNPNPFGAWENADVGYVSITTDCGSAQTGYIFFLVYIITCNYVVLPTYIAVVLNNVFEESVKSHSLVEESELKLFVEAWVATFGRKERITFPVERAEDQDDDPKSKKKNKPKHNFDNFDNLLMTLDMKGCKLYIDKNTAAYKLATTKFRDERGKTSAGDLKPCTVECKELAAVLLSVTEKVKPVTIVDILRRNLAVSMLQEEGKRPPEPKQRAREGQLHANVNFPQDKKEIIKKEGLELKDLVYSYNVYVVLDQLARLKEDPITPDAHKCLKKLVVDDDEDLFIYFEEYVENSGPDYSKEECAKVLMRFKKKAVNVYSRSAYVSKGENDEDDGKGNEPQEEDDDQGANENVKGEGTDENGANANNDSEEDDRAGADADMYGSIVDDNDGGVLDLQNWVACRNCSEPVEKSWDKCPSCRAVVPR